MRDNHSQQSTDRQFIQITAPQKDNADRGPHLMRFQERESGPGQIFLRAGGDYIISTNDFLIEEVGDEDNPSDKITVVSRNKLVKSEKFYLNLAELHLFVAKKFVVLLAGEDCDQEDSDEKGPCIGQVIVYKDGVAKISDRVFASCSGDAETLSTFNLKEYFSGLGSYNPNPLATEGTT